MLNIKTDVDIPNYSTYSNYFWTSESSHCNAMLQSQLDYFKEKEKKSLLCTVLK